MNYLVPDYYSKFQCTGSNCIRNCCQEGWNIAIDDESYQRYMAVGGALGEKLRDNIIEWRGSHKFKLDDCGSCPFLTKDRLCGVYIELGPEQMNYVCATYPRQYCQYADLMESNLKISCPEAARLLLTHKDPISFVFAESDDPLYINVDKELFDNLFLARSVSIDIMQFRSLPLWKRAVLTAMLASQLQELIKQGVYDFSSVLQEYSAPEHFEEKLSALEQALGGAHTNEQKCILTGYFISGLTTMFEHDDKHFAVYLNLFHKYISSGQYSFGELEQEFNTYYQDTFYQYENFFVYWLFQYYMDALNGKDLYQSISLMIFNCYIVKILGILTWLDHGKQLELSEQIDIFSNFSIYLEHSPKVYNQLYKILEEKEVSSITGLALLMYG